MSAGDRERGLERHMEIPGLRSGAAQAYAQAVTAGQFVFLAGMEGTNDQGRLISLEFEPQARQTFRNIETALRHVGSTFADIVTMTVFITDWRYGPRFKIIRQEILGDNLAPSALIGVAQLADPAMLVEIQCTAVRHGS